MEDNFQRGPERILIMNKGNSLVTLPLKQQPQQAQAGALGGAKTKSYGNAKQQQKQQQQPQGGGNKGGSVSSEQDSSVSSSEDEPGWNWRDLQVWPPTHFNPVGILQ